MMFGYGDSWPLWQLVLMESGMIIFSGLVIWTVYSLFFGTTRANGGGQRIEGPRQILDQRLAKGEINPEQYRQARELIDHDGHKKTSIGFGT